MAIVGTAYVRLRVIGDKLKKDIGDSVSKAVEDSTADLDKVGKTIGDKLSESTTKEVERSLGSQMGRVSDEIGETIGRRMAENMDFSLRSFLPPAFRNGFSRLTPIVSRAGDALGDAFGSFKTKIEKQFGGKGGKGGIGGIIMSGLGVLITVLPSVLAGAGAVIGAYAATAVTAVAAIGPAAAGAGLAAVAAFSAIKISAGLVGMAMKYPSDALTDFQERAKAFKGIIAEPIQVGLLSGLNASMRLLSPMLDALKPQFTALGIEVGNIAIGFADAIRQGAMFDRIGRILDTNNVFIRDAGGGVSKLGQAFIVLLDHLRPVTQEIGEMVGQFGDWALRAINAASASGELDGWINRMWDSFRRLMGIVVDFGVGIYNVFSAAQPAAGNLTTSLENIGRKFREWTGDPANQDRMVAFFEKMRVVVAQVNDILGDLVGAGLRGLENTNLTSLSTGLETLRSLGPPIAQMFRAIQEAAGPSLQSAFQSFADIITSLANSGVIGILAAAFANMLQIIAAVLALPFVGEFLAFAAGLATLMKTVGLVVTVITSLWSALKPLIAIVRVLAVVFGGIPLAIAAVVAALVYFLTQTETGRAILSAAWDAIKVAIEWAINAIGVAIDWLVSAFQSAWTWIQGATTGIWNAVSTAFNAVLSVVQTVWGAISGFLTTVVTTIWNFITTAFTAIQNTIVGVWNAIWGFLQPIIQGISDFITGAISFIVTAIETYLNILWEIWSRIWPLLALPLRVLIGVILLIWEGIRAGIEIAVNFISDVITTVWDAIWDFLKATMETIRNGITTAWNAVWSFISGILATIRDFIRGVWDAIWGFISAALDRMQRGITNIWNAIWGFIQPILTTIGNFIRNVWDTISNAINTVMNAIRNVIQSVWNAVSGFISSVLGTIRNTISSVWGGISSAISSTMSTIQNTIQSVWNSITGFLRGAMETIRGIVGGVWDALQGAGSGVVSGLKSAVNAAIGIVNGAISGINNIIDGANWLPGVDIPHVRPIPRLAKGGTVSPRGGGTLAMIAEAGRPERVEPLDPQGLSKRDRAMIEFLAGGAGGATNVNVYLGVGQLVPLIAEVVEEKQDDLANRVLTGTKG